MAAQKSDGRVYKGFTPRMGVYMIRHEPSGRVLLGSSPHLTGALNRHRFQLGLGSHPEPVLQADWSRDGASSFAFEIVDELAPDERDPGRDPGADLEALQALWRERLGLAPGQTYGD